MEVLSQQFAHQLLRPPLFAAEVGEEEGIGNVRLIGGVVVPFIKDALKMTDKGFSPAVKTDQSGDVVGDKEGVIPSTTLVKSGIGLKVLPQLRVVGR